MDRDERIADLAKALIADGRAPADVTREMMASAAIAWSVLQTLEDLQYGWPQFSS